MTLSQDHINSVPPAPTLSSIPPTPMDDARTAETVERIFFELRKVMVGQTRDLSSALAVRAVTGIMSPHTWIVVSGFAVRLRYQSG